MGVNSFRNTFISSGLDEVERHFDASIETPEPEKCFYTCCFPDHCRGEVWRIFYTPAKLDLIISQDGKTIRYRYSGKNDHITVYRIYRPGIFCQVPGTE